MTECNLNWPAAQALSEWLDTQVSPEYQKQPLAQDWARISKVTEEAGEAIEAFIGATGQNPRKGVTCSMDDVLSELADVALTGIYALIHFAGPEQAREVLTGRQRRHHERIGLPFEGDRVTADLRADLVAALREESLNLGCAGITELDRIGDALGRVADRVERAGRQDNTACCPAYPNCHEPVPGPLVVRSTGRCPVCADLGIEQGHPAYTGARLGDVHHGQYDPARPQDVTRALLARDPIDDPRRLPDFDPWGEASR